MNEIRSSFISSEYETIERKGLDKNIIFRIKNKNLYSSLKFKFPSIQDITKEKYIALFFN